MLLPNVNPSSRTLTRDCLTECGKWYYDLVTGDGVFVNVDYNAKSVKAVRDSYKTTFSAYGLTAASGKSFFTVFPTFAIAGTKQGNAYYFTVSDSDTLTDLAYETYCKRIWTKIKAIDASAVTSVTVPKSKTSPMELTYQYNGKTCTLKISYGQNSTNQSWGILFDIK